jgi:hypothetical protein
VTTALWGNRAGKLLRHPPPLSLLCAYPAKDRPGPAAVNRLDQARRLSDQGRKDGERAYSSANACGSGDIFMQRFPDRRREHRRHRADPQGGLHVDVQVYTGRNCPWPGCLAVKRVRTCHQICTATGDAAVGCSMQMIRQRTPRPSSDRTSGPFRAMNEGLGSVRHILQGIEGAYLFAPMGEPASLVSCRRIATLSPDRL